MGHVHQPAFLLNAANQIANLTTTLVAVSDFNILYNILNS
jgi:hypothetical protein